MSLLEDVRFRAEHRAEMLLFVNSRTPARGRLASFEPASATHTINRSSTSFCAGARTEYGRLHDPHRPKYPNMPRLESVGIPIVDK